MSSMKRKLLFVFTCVLLVIMCAGNAFAGKKSSVDMKIKVEKGIDDKCRYGRYIPVRFTLSDASKDVQGKIIMYFPSEYSLETNYMVEKGGETTISFPVKMQEYNDINYVEYDIVDDKGKVIQTDKVNLSSNYKEKVCVGILSDEFASLAYIDNKTLDERINGNQSYGETALCEITKLDTKYIANEPQDLDYFDIIIINNFNIETLSDEQINTLEEWVNAGGMILVGTGENSDKSYSKFSFAEQFKLENLAPVEIQGSVTSTTINTYKISSDEGTATNILGAGGAGAYMILGQGTFAVVGFDLGVQNVSSFFDENSSEFSSMLTRLMGNLTISNMAYGERAYAYSDGSYVWDYLVQREIDVKLPNVVLYSFIFLLYVALLVFVFILLKSKNKSNYTFVSLIGLSLVFCGLIYVIGVATGTRITKPMINYVDVVNLDGKNYNSYMYLGCEAPNNKKYNVSVNPKYKFVGVGNDDYWGYYGDNKKSLKDVKYSVSETTEGTIIKNMKVSPFSANSYQFTNSGTVDTDVSEGIDVSYFDRTYEGTITNISDYTYENAMVIFDNVFCYLGDIKPGDVIDLEKIESSNRKVISYYGNYTDNIIKNPEDSLSKFRDYCLRSYAEAAVYGSAYTNNIQLVYFSDSDDKVINENYGTLGSTMYIITAETKNERDGRKYYPNVHTVIQDGENYGSYEENSVEFYNGVVEPVRVICYLDNDIDTIMFSKQDNSGNYGYSSFSGKTAIIDVDGNEHEIIRSGNKIRLTDYPNCIREDEEGRKFVIVEYTYSGTAESYLEVLLPVISGEGAVIND